MLNKINLVIKAPTGNLLVVKKPQNSQWQLPYLYSDKITHNIIKAILKTLTECGIDDVRSIKYLFDSNATDDITSINIPMIYYEVLIEKHRTLNPKSIYSFLVYHSMISLGALSNKSYGIEVYLRTIEEQIQESKKDARLYYF